MPKTARTWRSVISLSMQLCTDPKLLDVAGAVNSLPALSLTSPVQPASQRAVAVGTGTGSSFVAPMVAPDAGDSRPKQTKTAVLALAAALDDALDDSAPEHEKTPVIPGFFAKRAKGLEPSTCSLGSYHSTN